MPVYQYVEEATGREVEFVVPVAMRDQVPGHRRVPVPRRINVVLGTPDPTTPAVAVPKALRQIEDTVNHREIARQSGYSTAQMKSIWGI